MSAFALDPEKAWFRTELAAHLGIRASSLQREFARLEKAGILRSWRDRGRKYYAIDRELPVLGELRGLLVRTVAVVDVLREALAPLRDRISAAFVFGSVAESQERPASDVDLMVVGRVGLADLSLVLPQAESTLRRPVNPVLFSVEEFRQRAREGDPFVSSVLAKPTLAVLGTVHDILGGTSGPRSARV